jgi:hypothetical protein
MERRPVETIATDPPVPGWVYVLTHPAWESLGMVKIGRTGRDPRTRAAEITSVSGLLAPCTIAWCSPVSDMAAAEKAVHRMLGTRRVRKRRELFRVDTVTAQQVVEAVARSLPASGRLFGVPARPMPARRPEASGRHQTPRRFGSWRHGRRRSLMPGRLAIGFVTLAALVFFYTMN